MNYGFLSDAEEEYLNAIRFYEDQRRGIGTALVQEFEKTVALAIERPEAWRIVHPFGIRRIELARFPFAIFFVVDNGMLLITAFAHYRRRPGYWLGRVKPNV